MNCENLSFLSRIFVYCEKTKNCATAFYGFISQVCAPVLAYSLGAASSDLSELQHNTANLLDWIESIESICCVDAIFLAIVQKNYTLLSEDLK